MYKFTIDDLQLPVAPSKLQMKMKNQNKTITLLNEGEVNFLKVPGLTEITFTALLPQSVHFFAKYPDKKFVAADIYLEKLKTLKTERKPFQFKVERARPGGEKLFDTEMLVSLEDYKLSEDAKDGFDVSVDITLKQYRVFATKTVSKDEDKNGKANGTINEQRPDGNKPSAKTHTVAKGDTLWAVAKRYYGDGSKYTKIYNANKDKVKSPNMIYVGQVLTIP